MTAARKIALFLAAASMTLAAECPTLRKGKRAAAQPAKPVVDMPPGADQLIFGSRTVLTHQGVAKGVLLSDIALVYEEGRRLELQRVNVTFFDKQGAHDGVMTSRTGTYNVAQSRLEAKGDVIITREDGRRLTTPQLVYDQARNQVFSDSAFTLIEPSKQLSGIGFETDPRLTTFKCHRACKAIAPVSIPVR